MLGNPVEPAPAFQKFLYRLGVGQTTELKVCRLALLRAIVTAAPLGVRPHEVVAPACSPPRA